MGGLREGLHLVEWGKGGDAAVRRDQQRCTRLTLCALAWAQDVRTAKELQTQGPLHERVRTARARPCPAPHPPRIADPAQPFSLPLFTPPLFSHALLSRAAG